MTEGDAPPRSREHARGGFAPLLWALATREGLTATTKAVLVALAARADPKGCCYPSIDRIADDTRLSARACQKAIPDLEAGGFLTVNRNTGRGHASVYMLNLKRPTDPIKGARRSPISDERRVQQVHPLPVERVHDVHPLNPATKAERVNVVRVKGAPRSPQLLIELPSTAAAKPPASARAKPAQNPRRGEPCERWHHLADRKPDGSPKVETSGPDAGRAIVGGAYLDTAADLVCKAAKITDPKWRGSWSPLIAWLRAGLDLQGVILPAVRSVSARSSYSPPVSLAYFDKPVRECKSGFGGQ